MDARFNSLTFEEVGTARAAIRVIRYLTVLTMAVALPLIVVIATPLVGWLLLATILLSPLIMAYVLLVASRQAERERRRAV